MTVQDAFGSPGRARCVKDTGESIRRLPQAEVCVGNIPIEVIDIEPVDLTLRRFVGQ